MESLQKSLLAKLEQQQQAGKAALMQKMQDELAESKSKLEEFIVNSKFPKTQERRYKQGHEKAC